MKAPTPAQAPAAAAAVPDTPPPRELNARTLAQVAHLLPPTAHALIRRLGAEAAVTLINTWPGVQLVVPRQPDANAAGARRWARYAELIGEEAMKALAAHWGGDVADVPVCVAALNEQRNRWLIARFDALTDPRGPALSTYRAFEELTLALAEAGQELTFREVQKAVNRAPIEPAPDAQADLFTFPHHHHHP